MRAITDFSQRELSLADLRFDPPRFSLDEIRSIARTQYGLEGDFTPLAGERDQNHRLRCADGRQFVLKISGSTELPDVVEMQVLALGHIQQQDSELPVPRMIPGLDGRLVGQAGSAAGQHAVRMLSWLPGRPYQDGPFPSTAGLHGLGQFIARLGKALQGFDHPAARHFMPWNMANGLIFSPQLRALMPQASQGLLADYFTRLERSVYPKLAQLRWQVIHQDGHGANLLRDSGSGEAVSGVIDFGDMIYGPLVCDLATCMSDFMEASPDPVATAIAMVRGYHAVLPLWDEELELLPDLLMVRQIMVLQLFEFMRRNMQQPQAFVTDDQPGIIAVLQKLAAMDRNDFAHQLKEALKHA